eukprot:GFYU01002102.1.p1 GENE.GFYU01002102.1~~GFYU01002102.1.p1  ORF type:complete len:236 (-),score=45.95 GFYU01002102.1:640-1347(-)
MQENNMTIAPLLYTDLYEKSLERSVPESEWRAFIYHHLAFKNTTSDYRDTKRHAPFVSRRTNSSKNPGFPSTAGLQVNDRARGQPADPYVKVGKGYQSARQQAMYLTADVHNVNDVMDSRVQQVPRPPVIRPDARHNITHAEVPYVAKRATSRKNVRRPSQLGATRVPRNDHDNGPRDDDDVGSAPTPPTPPATAAPYLPSWDREATETPVGHQEPQSLPAGAASMKDPRQPWMR